MSSIISFPASASPRHELDQTQKSIDATRAHKADLDEQAKKLEGELKELQDKLVVTGKAVQKSEDELSDAEDKLRILNEQLKAKTEALAVAHRKLAALTQAAIKLSRTPPEAMVMLPGDSMQAMKASRALAMVQSSVKEQMQSIEMQLAELERLKEKVSTRAVELNKKQAGLKAGRKALAAQLADRKALLQKLGLEQKTEEEKLAKLARKANSLQDLLASVFSEEHLGLKADERAPQGTRGKLRSFTAARGHIHVPVSGKLARAFGDSDGRGGTSRGVVIDAREKAAVTAPYDGEVVFAGPFLGYGQLVILKHSDGFHTLLAGLKRIDAETGQFLLEGEPIGAMGDGESDSRLYVELRKNSQPVDPAPWMGMKQR